MIVDPTGGIVAYLIHKISQLPVAYRKKLWRRITYVDAGAKDYIVPSPLLFKLSADEELFETANRFPQVLKLRDPDLQSAPILGWNSLFECAEYSNQIAAAPGEQIGFVADFIAYPETLSEVPRFAQILRNALVVLIENSLSLAELEPLLTNHKWRRHLLLRTTDSEAVSFFTGQYDR